MIYEGLEYENIALSIIESIYDIKLNEMKAGEITKFFYERRKPVKEVWLEGYKEGIKTVYRGLNKAGLMSEEAMEKSVKDLINHIREKYND